APGSDGRAGWPAPWPPTLAPRARGKEVFFWVLGQVRAQAEDLQNSSGRQMGSSSSGTILLVTRLRLQCVHKPRDDHFFENPGIRPHTNLSPEVPAQGI